MENIETKEKGEGFESVNDRPKESAAKMTAVKSGRGAPRFDRDRVIKIVMISLGILVVAGMVMTNIRKKTEKTVSETRRASSVSVPEEFRRRSQAAASAVESAVAEVNVEDGVEAAEEERERIEAEVYGYLPGYDPVSSGPAASPPPPPVPRRPEAGVSAGGGGGNAAAVPASDPAVMSKLIPPVEGNGSVYGGQATTPPQDGGVLSAIPGISDIYGQYAQTAHNLQSGYPQYAQYGYPQYGAAAPQYTSRQPYAVQPYGAAMPAAGYGAAAASPANELNQQGYEAQNMQGDKQNFYDTGGAGGGGGVINTGYFIGEDTLWNGTIIPAVLVTGINTDLPGEVMARVSENIYDSLTGKRLLIPQGAILMAKYNSSISYAQGRVQIIWNTLTRPDGYQVELGGMNGVDDRGMSGQKGEYHENWFQYLKAAGIITMFTLANGEMTRAAATAANTDVAAANQNIVNQLAGNITSRALNIQPTITVKSGEKINVMLNKAVYLPPVEGYKPVERYRRN